MRPERRDRTTKRKGFDAVKSAKEMKRLVKKYHEKEVSDDMTEKTFMLDMLYFIALSVNRDRYEWAQGFHRFKNDLKSAIEQDNWDNIVL